MRRIATFMSVKPGMEEQYREEHRNIWPEVVEGITRFGIRNYSIFMHESELYSFFEVGDLDKAIAMAAADPCNRRWQKHMADFFDVGPSVQEGATVYPEEVFYAAGYEVHTPMQRAARLLQVKAGLEADYMTAHKEIGQEMFAWILQAGIGNYSIFMLGRKVFSYFEVEELDNAMRVLASNPNNQRWQKHMAHMFDVGPCIRESETVYLEEVFHVD